MPTYDFKCGACGNIQDEFLLISESETARPPCKVCKEPTARTFIPANFDGQICFRGEWDGKLDRETRYRKKRAEELQVKQRDNHFIPKLAPNVNGERVESWSDAKALAKDKGFDTSNYDQKVNLLSKGNT